MMTLDERLDKAEKIILGIPTIEDSDINIFFKNKEAQSENILSWTESTKKKLRNIYTNFMIDANLVTVIDKEKQAEIREKKMNEKLELQKQKEQHRNEYIEQRHLSKKIQVKVKEKVRDKRCQTNKTQRLQ